jgi:hypothetical protein
MCRAPAERDPGVAGSGSNFPTLIDSPHCAPRAIPDEGVRGYTFLRFLGTSRFVIFLCFLPPLCCGAPKGGYDENNGMWGETDDEKK